MQDKKGITLVSLVITIIVLLILASVATYSGLNVVNSSKLTAFTTELKIMQTQVNAIYEEDSAKQIGEEIIGNIQTQANKVFTESEAGIVSQEGYRYWSQDLIKELGIEGVEQDFFVNLEKRSVVSYQGLKYEGKTYYTLNQVPNGLYNVEYIEPTAEKPIFEISSEGIGINKWRITIFNIQYKGYIDKWQVKYQLEGESNWNTSEDLSFIVNKSGNYKIKIVNGEIASDEQKKYLGYSADSEYVKNGLLLYYDGINNTRDGNNPNSTTWEDLSENQNDGILYNMNTASGYYNSEEKGYVFLENSSYIESKNNIGILGDDLYTTEVVMKPWEEGKVSGYNPFTLSTPFFWGTTTDTTVGKSYMIYYNRTNAKFEVEFINNQISSDSIYDNVIGQTSKISFRKTRTGEVKRGDTNLGIYNYNGRQIPSTYQRL